MAISFATFLRAIELYLGSRDEELRTASRGGLDPRRSTETPPVPLVEQARAVTTVPLHAGFGIGSPMLASEAARLVDGIVMGSAAIEAVERGGGAELYSFVHGLRHALDAAVPVGGTERT